MNSVAYNSDENYRFLKHLLLDEFGVVVDEGQEHQINDKLDSVLLENDLDSLMSLKQRLNSADASVLRTKILHAITERNVDWFNYSEINSVICDYVLPNISKNRIEPFRVWVIGCGRGQCAFSLAIDTDKFSKKNEQDLAIEIIATDSSKVTIDIAKKARFTSSLLSGLTEIDRDKYMTHENDEWLVNDSIKSMVLFSVANPLNFSEENLAKVDLIICPDVLAYYTVAVKTRVLESFAQHLNKAGMLITGAHEPILPFCKQFSMVEHDAGTFYRKLK